MITSLQIPTVSVITLTSGLGSLVNLPHKAKRQKFKGCRLQTHAQSEVEVHKNFTYEGHWCARHVVAWLSMLPILLRSLPERRATPVADVVINRGANMALHVLSF